MIFKLIKFFLFGAILVPRLKLMLIQISSRVQKRKNREGDGFNVFRGGVDMEEGFNHVESLEEDFGREVFKDMAFKHSCYFVDLGFVAKFKIHGHVE